MFNQAIAKRTLPRRLSTDHDPLFRFHRWLANLRILEIEEIKSVPHAPMSHPFIERLIGTIRRECLDRTFFWNSIDLDRKLKAFQNYYNGYRDHRSLGRYDACKSREHFIARPREIRQVCLEAALSRSIRNASRGVIGISSPTRRPLIFAVRFALLLIP
jgi:transposase InsO family protein